MRGHTASGRGRGENSLKLLRGQGGGVTVGVGILLVRRVGVDIHLLHVYCVRESVLFIGTQFSDLYTAVDTDTT
jgi:hypothetical protein